jgi:ectoine hydroxylase-related dioxygenase (phytanoyl-CoA dioxygenase family)
MTTARVPTEGEELPLSADQLAAYNRDGFIVVEDVIGARELEELRAVTDALVEASRTVDAHDEIYDLEPGHSREDPRVRRIKTPHMRHSAYERLSRHPRILSVLRQLVNPAIRFDTSKLNMKSPGHGAAVEWHQDWAFYPHTNSDLCAVGVMIDDCAPENGPLLCIPGSHKGPVLDHHAEDGHFCGAIDPHKAPVDLGTAVACTGPAGSISVHHAMTLHGSATNTSDKPRRLLLFQYRAADAWPLVAPPGDWDAYTGMLLCGEDDPKSPRVEAVPVRLPFPKARSEGSIYEIQRGAPSFFNKQGAA